MSAGSRPVGRRSGKHNTQEVIIQSARKLFAEKGYDRTTLRGVAVDANVDPALIVHYFKTKQGLFVAAMLPIIEGPKLVVEAIKGSHLDMGERLSRVVARLLSDQKVPELFTALIRAAASEPKAAEMIREFAGSNILQPLARSLDGKDAELRAALIGAQLIGLIMARHVVQIQPLAQASPDNIARVLAPVLQQYIDEPLR